MVDRILAHVQLAREAEKWVGICPEDLGPNRGANVDRFTAFVFGRNLSVPWCACFVAFCVKEVRKTFGFGSYFRSRGGVRDMWEKNALLRVKTPRVGDIVCWGVKSSKSGHCGIIVEVLADNLALTVEGNTGPDGKNKMNREGDNCYKKTRKLENIGNFELLGFIRPFP